LLLGGELDVRGEGVDHPLGRRRPPGCAVRHLQPVAGGAPEKGGESHNPVVSGVVVGGL